MCDSSQCVVTDGTLKYKDSLTSGSDGRFGIECQLEYLNGRAGAGMGRTVNLDRLCENMCMVLSADSPVN